MFDLDSIITFYSWIKANFMTCVFITLFLLSGYGIYEFIDGFAKSYGVELASQHFELKRAVASYTALDMILDREINKFDASRAAIFRFHDSEKDLSLMSFFFVSVANITSAPGITVDVSSITNVPASTFAPVLPNMIEGKSSFYLVNDLPPGPLREFELKRGCKIVVFVPIDDINSNLIGFITLDWLDIQNAPKDADQESALTALRADAIRISSYFSLSPIRDK